MARLNQDAKAVLKEAITASFANTQATLESANDNWIGDREADTELSSKVNDYFDNTVSTAYDNNPVKEIILQKYLAFFGASGESVEAYNDYRRLKAEGRGYEVKLNNPKNDKQFPQRLGYGGSDVTANQAIKEAFGDGQYVYTESVWWAGGTR